MHQFEHDDQLVQVLDHLMVLADQILVADGLARSPPAPNFLSGDVLYGPLNVGGELGQLSKVYEPLNLLGCWIEAVLDGGLAAGPD